MHYGFFVATQPLLYLATLTVCLGILFWQQIRRGREQLKRSLYITYKQLLIVPKMGDHTAIEKFESFVRVSRSCGFTPFDFQCANFNIAADRTYESYRIYVEGLRASHEALKRHFLEIRHLDYAQYLLEVDEIITSLSSSQEALKVAEQKAVLFCQTHLMTNYKTDRPLSSTRDIHAARMTTAV